MAQTATYQEKVNELLKEKSTIFSIGLFVLFFIVSGVLIATNQRRINVAEIDKKNREAYLAQQQNGPFQYTIQEGEGLWQIAEKVTGDGENWVKIAAANNITNPDTIEAGQKITIPDVTVTQTPKYQNPTPTTVPGNVTQDNSQNLGQIDGGMTGKANPTVKEYTLLEGEGLWQAAEKVYGDGNMWTKIAEANNITNPDAVYPGMKLKMPSF